MKGLEDRLRDAFEAAGRTVLPETLPGVPAPRRRDRHLLVPLAAAASVAAVIAVAAVVLPLVLSGGRQTGGHPAGGPSPSTSVTPTAPATATAPPGAPLPGAPRFIADLPAASGTTAGPLQIRSAATGKVVATDLSVRGTALAALAGGRTFLIATPAAGNACATRLQRFTLSAAGRPSPLTPLPGPALPGQVASLAAPGQVASLAASANGRVVAYADAGCGKGSRTYLGVVDVATGATTAWTGVDVMGEGSGQMLAGGLSISADGRLLVYETASHGRHTTTFTVRALPTSAPAGTAAKRSRVIARFPVSPRGGFAGAAVSPGGTTLDVCREVGGKLPSLTLASYDVATGRRLRVLATLPATGSCGPLDPSGRFLLVSLTGGSVTGAGGTGTPGLAVFREAEVALATGRTARLTVTTPSGEMSSAVTGMLLAW